MPPLASDGEFQRSSPPRYPASDDSQTSLQARLQTLELHMAREQQRQQDQVEGALHALREQLATLLREQQQQQATLAHVRAAAEELRQEVGEALYRLSQDVDRVALQTEARANRTVEQLRNEILASLLAREKTTVKRHRLGELLMALGKQLQEAGEDDAS